MNDVETYANHALADFACLRRSTLRFGKAVALASTMPFVRRFLIKPRLAPL